MDVKAMTPGFPTATEYSAATRDGLGVMMHLSAFADTEIGRRHSEAILAASGHTQLRATRDWARALLQAPAHILTTTVRPCDLLAIQKAAMGWEG